MFDGYICATILDKKGDYTSAYTLKNICIQLLSFFTADFIESADHGGIIDVQRYRQDEQMDRVAFEQEFGFKIPRMGTYVCEDCKFGVKGAPSVINPVLGTGPGDIISPAKCYIADICFRHDR